MDEHQSILAQVCNNGAAGLVPPLAGVAILEGGFVVREIESDTAFPHREG
jgi:hypothetical protein